MASKEYYEKHKDEIRAKRKARYAANPERERTYAARWRKQNPGRRSACNKLYWYRHREQLLEYQRERRRRLREQREDGAA